MAVTITVQPSGVYNGSAWTVTSDKDDATAKTITVFADYSGTVAGTVKVTTSVAHTFLTEDVVTITGTTNYNGTFDLTKIDADEFYITHSWDGDDATGTVTLDNPNFRIKAELIISATTESVKWQPKGTLSFDFRNILWALITYDVIGFDSLNIQTPNSSSYKGYTIKFTEFWESTANALITGADTTSGTKYIYEVDVPVADFADYNLSDDDELFLTERPTTKNKIRIGDNLISSWTNIGAHPYNTFTSSGRNITSAIETTGNNGMANSIISKSLLSGAIVNVICDFTLNDEDLPTFFVGDAARNVKSNKEILAEGLNYIDLTMTEAVTSPYLYIEILASKKTDYSLNKIYVSEAYNELDYLTLISEETTIIPAFTQYDVDGTSLRTTSLDGVAISGERGVCPISALLFAHSTTQVESILFKAGTGLNLDGTVLIEGWHTGTDVYDVFTVTGTRITDCQETTGNNGAALSGSAAGGEGDGFGVFKDEVINIVCTVTHNGGTLPWIFLSNGHAGPWLVAGGKEISNNVRLSAGANDINLTATKTVLAASYPAGVYVCIYNPNPELVDFSTTGDVTVTGTTFLSEGKTFERDTKCYPSHIRIEWLNKFGAFDAYTFLANYDENRRSNRKYYKDTSDVEQILDIESFQEIIAYSLFETQTMLDWLKTIQDSEKVYWIVDNVRIEVVATSTSQSIKKLKQRNRMSLTFRRII